MYGRRKKSSYISRRQNGGNPDYILLGLVGLLTIFGWVMVYSSSVIVAFSQDKPSWYYFFRQFLWISAGTISGFILYRLDYKRLAKLSPIIIGVAIFLLLGVLIAGQEINGSKRWIDLGFFDLQASEFAKLAFIIYLASWLSRKVKTNKRMSELKRYFLYDMIPFLLILATILILILIEPDLGTTGIIGLTALSIYYLAGSGFIHNFGFSLILVTSTLVGVLAAALESYRIKRFTTFIEVVKTGSAADRLGSGYQLSQVLTAVGTGGLFGLGFGQSKQKFNYLGETAFSDTIFAIIAEEFGLLGASIIATSFLYFALRGMKIARNAPDKLASLLAAGITFWISLQAFLNIAANVGLIPLTGITLPFISYGGSSIIVVMSGMGILLNISKYVKLD